ncbi:DUF6350 family protein [Streptomyces luteireticuli]|uniref:Integral membrane protein n=1 Tax=Streptomyces luteireticuli TaxID=173858 RepID=A0ABN0YY78_9ACTN
MALVTQYAHSGTSLPSYLRFAARGTPGTGRAFFGGALAAGLGLGAFATLVLALWIVSPYPDSGPAGALHIATGLWLLAHGAELVRTETLSGTPAPVGLTPLLFTVVPCVLVHRAARQAPAPDCDEDCEEDAEYAEGIVDVEAGDEPIEDLEAAGPPPPPAPAGPPRPPLPPRTAFTALLGGYLLVSLAAVLYASSGPVRVDPLSALLHLPLVAAVPAAAGVWMASGCPPWTPPPRVRRVLGVVPRRMREWFTYPHVLAVARATAAGTGVLFGGAALLLAVELARGGGAAQEAVAQLAAGWSGRTAVVLLSIALLPNAVVWTAAYGLGAGFVAGAGGVLAPVALPVLGDLGHPLPLLPRFPLLAALPGPGEAGPLGLAGCAAVVAGAGVAVASAAVPRRPATVGRCEAMAIAFLAAVASAVLVTVLAAAAGGPLGNATLARFGPPSRFAGLACLVWTAVVGVPGALIVRHFRKAPRPAEAPEKRRSWWRRTGFVLGLDVPERRRRARPRQAPRWWRAVAGWLGFAVGGDRGTEVVPAQRPHGPEPETDGDGLPHLPEYGPEYAPESLPLLPVNGTVLGADGKAEPPRRHRRRGSRAARAADRAARREAARTARREARQARKARKAPMPPVPDPASGVADAPDWHDTGVRRARWAALKDSGGGLMADFEPRDPERLFEDR